MNIYNKYLMLKKILLSPLTSILAKIKSTRRC